MNSMLRYGLGLTIASLYVVGFDLGALVVPQDVAALLVSPVAVVTLATTDDSYVAYRQLHRLTSR